MMKRENFYPALIITLLALSIVITFGISSKDNQKTPVVNRELISKSGVCPPFQLYDEEGMLIDPVNNINADKPYSPKQTCGKCHDYEKITQGYHFQQGKDETATGKYAERYQWVSTPGNYGGNWCSPAPLYNYLSPKENKSAAEMDMTSFTFITNGCGTCHPGGGPFEYDRNGNRYDKFMDSAGYKAGAANNFDGDYFKAHWNRSGVGEGDCNLCHLPEYDFKSRSQHLMNWNFRWMATAGSGLAKVEGSVKDSVDVKVSYDISKFDKTGKVSLHLVREPRNETCLNCHSKAQWKKRGASFTAYSDVHVAKGVKCIDCHPAGSMAADDRIKGREVHQIAKGDDPSGWVRNDLDNTMRTCSDCHLSGYLNAPIAKHNWLPSLHLDKLSCQACHIPERKVKSALAQMSDVYNPGTKISPPAKYIWTFYDQHLNYWNHYGELSMFTAKDQPTDNFVPQFARYKGKIYPVNPVHSAWPGIYTEGEKGLHQPRMKDIYEMWTAHRKDKSKYRDLAKIKDHNADSIPEVNTPEEIDAFIVSVTEHLTNIGYDFNNRKIVWVNNDRMYFNGKEYRILEKEEYESSPYASVYKYSHDVFPAKAALGSKGCLECHSTSSKMFYAQIIKYPFGENGDPVREPQYKRLAMNGFMTALSVIREEYIKSIEYPAILLMVIIMAVFILLSMASKHNYFTLSGIQLTITYIILAVGYIFIWLKPDVRTYILPDRLWFDINHFPLSMVAIFSGSFIMLWMRKNNMEQFIMYKFLYAFIITSMLSGFVMMIKFDAIENIVRLAYTLFDIGIIGITLSAIFFIIKHQFYQTHQVIQH